MQLLGFAFILTALVFAGAVFHLVGLGQEWVSGMQLLGAGIGAAVSLVPLVIIAMERFASSRDGEAWNAPHLKRARRGWTSTFGSAGPRTVAGLLAVLASSSLGIADAIVGLAENEEDSESTKNGLSWATAAVSGVTTLWLMLGFNGGDEESGSGTAAVATTKMRGDDDDHGGDEDIGDD